MPGNRCPDCNKFVGLENGEPEINSLDVTPNTGGILRVEADIRHVRQCADCSNELKEIDEHVEEEVDVEKFEGWDKLDEVQKKAIKDALENGEITVEADDSGTNADESGGHRYKKNMIVCTADYTLEFEWQPDAKLPSIKFKYNGQLRMENQASNYNEI
jgi:hypothetical protein